MDILKCKDLCMEYKNNSTVYSVLNNISLNVGQGEFISIMGKSGSGKSTLLYALSGLKEHL